MGAGRVLCGRVRGAQGKDLQAPDIAHTPLPGRQPVPRRPCGSPNGARPRLPTSTTLSNLRETTRISERRLLLPGRVVLRSQGGGGWMGDELEMSWVIIRACLCGDGFSSCFIFVRWRDT